MDLPPEWSSSYMVMVITVLVCLSPSRMAVAGTNLNLGNETDLEALLEFKGKIRDDPFGVLKSWNESIHFCEWRGVKCGGRRQQRRVILLELSSQSLTGSVSPFIGNLSFVEELSLFHNSFTQQLPPELGRLKRLHTLWLNNNSFTGEIPSNISGCSNLVEFSVAYNNLITGKIPEAIGSLSKLQYINLADNNLIGALPPSLGNLSSLETFIAPFNSISGSIPSSFGQLSKLKYLSLEVNGLSGFIPPSIFNLSSIATFSVSLNQLQGSLPPDLGFRLPNLVNFAIDANQITGSLPTSLSNLSNLNLLGAGRNNLTGKVPRLEKLNNLYWLILSGNGLGNGEADDLDFMSSFTNGSNLQVLGLNDNNFGGTLPESFSNLPTNLRRLHIESNQISGSFPTGIVHILSLEDFNAESNQLTGSIPSEIENLKNLQLFDTSHNKLFGTIPSSLGNLSLLTRLILDNNNLEGIIPSSLGNCKYLNWLSLAGNDLNGTIPPTIFSLSSLLMVLNLSHNQLTGPLPLGVGNLNNIRELDVSNNILFGQIPSSLGSCLSLEKLYIQGNLFQGEIPSSFSSLRGIKFLDISRNNFSGEIPTYFQNFDLEYLNMSFNDFQGVIPKGRIFSNASAFFVNGNSKICGNSSESKLSTCNFEGSKKITSTFVFKIIISIVSGLLGVILVLYLVYICWSKRLKNRSQSDSHESFSLFRVSYQVLFRSTDGFSSANLIGMGSFGSVYKGILGEEKTLVAVKVFNLLNRDALKSFMAECETLRNIKHRNLVKVLTACSSIDQQGNDFKALVYEFMENGSLEEWLHPDSREPKKKLNLIQRLNIAIDVATALDYLHYGSHATIVHCDIKPSNILLDRELVGRVGDFGLARFLPTTTSHQDFPNEQSVCSGFRGSIGYVAPEYGMGSMASTHGDVYSFGIILLELFTGRRPTDDMFRDGFDLHNHVRAAWPDRVTQLVDPVLFETGGEEETTTTTGVDFYLGVQNDRIRESLISIFGVGIACSAELPRERTSMVDVVAELQSIRGVVCRTTTTHP